MYLVREKFGKLIKDLIIYICIYWNIIGTRSIFSYLSWYFREGTEDIKFKLNKKRKYESKTYPWHESDQFKQEIKTIGEFIDKIKKECPNARIEILPQSCEEGNINIFSNFSKC